MRYVCMNCYILMTEKETINSELGFICNKCYKTEIEYKKR